MTKSKVFLMYAPLIVIFLLLLVVLVYRARNFDKILTNKGLEYGKNTSVFK